MPGLSLFVNQLLLLLPTDVGDLQSWGISAMQSFPSFAPPYLRHLQTPLAAPTKPLYRNHPHLLSL